MRLGACGPQPNTLPRRPRCLCSQEQPPFPLRRHFTVSRAHSNALRRPVFSFLHGGEAGGAPRGSGTASVGPGLLPRTDVQRRALPSLPRPSGKKHSLLPNQSPQYPRRTARWIMVFDLILRSLLAGTELATPKGAFPLPVPIHPLQPGCQDSLTSSPTVFDH